MKKRIKNSKIFFQKSLFIFIIDLLFYCIVNKKVKHFKISLTKQFIYFLYYFMLNSVLNYKSFPHVLSLFCSSATVSVVRAT